MRKKDLQQLLILTNRIDFLEEETAIFRERMQHHLVRIEKSLLRIENRLIEKNKSDKTQIWKEDEDEQI